MKLSVLHLNAPTSLAGAERVVLTYLQEHDRSAFTVNLASYLNYRRPDNSFTREAARLGIPLKKIMIGRQHLTQGIRDTIALIRGTGAQVLHTHGYRSDVAGFIAARITGVPIVSTVHGWTPLGLKLRIYENLARFCLRRFDRVFCVSRELQSGLAQAGFKTERLAYLNNAVTLGSSPLVDRQELRERAGFPPGGRLMVAVGRLSPEKGYDVLLHAFRLLNDGSRGPLRLVIVGEGGERGTLERLAGDLGVAEKVVFTGHCSNVEDYYRMADLFVMPSRSEGLPMALLEAMAAGTPVVCTAVGGIPEVVAEGVTGLLAPPEAPEELACRMRELLDDPGLAARLAENGARLVRERFAAGPWARKMEQVYREVAK